MVLPNYVHRVNRLVISDNVGKWCRIPYRNHQRGCPNYGIRRCPPKARRLDEVFDLEKPLYLINSEFNLEQWEKKMKEKHPDWSREQCRCVLYWQNKSRKQLQDRVLEFFHLDDNPVINFFTICPEGMGLNVYATGRLCGLELEKIKDLKICQHVALAGTELPKNNSKLFKEIRRNECKRRLFL